MAAIPRTLVIGRCRRCGARLRMYDDYYMCPRCGSLFCVICGEKKLRGRCPFDGSQLIKK
ncbi:MAG: hypothetical protein RXQ74_00480 [Caldivirga sp.]|jgi:Zn finger protein HypA/HybF involved in hydrogenase expression|nr:MAG: hypothetical protein AT709_02785 [Caldivirga sp. MG_3]NAZ29084.1 hypothetical protein [Caldivirga sp.]